MAKRKKLKIKLSGNIIAPIHECYKLGEYIRCNEIICESVYGEQGFRGCKDCNIDKIQMRNNNFKACNYEDVKDLIIK